MTTPPSILLVSNGHGEDLIASRLLAEMGTCHVSVLPLSGAGQAYVRMGHTPIMTQPPMPSGGFIRSPKDLIRDLSSGLIGQLRKAQNMVRVHAKKADLVVAVGDVFCLGMAAWGHKTPVYFLATAKSDSFMPHSWLERHLIKKWARKVYTRDALTATNLASKGLPAVYLGNPMMDGLWDTQTPLNISNEAPILALLPGSRKEAYANLIYMLDIARTLQDKIDCNILWAKSPELRLTELISHYPKNTWSFCPQGTWMRDTYGTLIHIVSHFPDVLSVSDVVLGLAGTANEQAIHVGKDVYAFEGFGPQSTLKRFGEQKALMGGRLTVITPRNNDAIVNALEKALQLRHPMPPPPTEKAAALIWEDVKTSLSLEALHKTTR